MATFENPGTMRVPKIKNNNAATQQITAEQLMREVPAYNTDEYRAPSNLHIMDQDELKDYKFRMRRDLEEKLRMQRHHMGTWIKYGEWEAAIGEFQRARSVFERAMEVDYQHVTLWLKYAEMEMRNKNANHARNIYDRACKHLPRVD
jgi:crooked neck